MLLAILHILALLFVVSLPITIAFVIIFSIPVNSANKQMKGMLEDYDEISSYPTVHME